ncbi:hypothetical protein H0H93_016549 [Arthromyces matolae]|nr:hypothetical protein H0H93_016549 [Arthromyces matolae]
MMVLLNGNKYACETCIKGHRSSNCRHTDRPLFEIKKKGRPVTQCDHCRQLRKTKQVHVKCICEAKEDHQPAQSGTKKGHTKIPDCATFPNGLPQALEASVAESSSDSDIGGLRIKKCNCKETGACHCCIPRKSVPRLRKKDAAPSLVAQDALIASQNDSTPRTPSHILARLAELRPVLPRPSHRTRSSSAHDPSSSSAHGLASRSHENAHFSPYGRAYDVNHEHHDTLATQTKQQPHLANTATNGSNISHSQNNNFLPIPTADTPFLTDEQLFRDQLRALEAATSTSTTWMPPPGMEDVIPSFPSTCGCGDNCRCPGCVEHNSKATPASSAFSSCTNPSSCSTCLDCTILSLPASLPPDTSLSIYDAFQTDSLDDWIRAVSSLPRVPPSVIPTTAAPTAANTAPRADLEQTSWEGYLPPITEQLPPDNEFGYSIKPCCGVMCKCDPETCECKIDDENGFDCRREMLFPTFEEQPQPQPSSPQHEATQQHHPQACCEPSPEDIDNDRKKLAYVRGRPHSSAGTCGGSNLNSFFDNMDIDQGRELFRPPYTVSEPPRSRSSSTSTSSSHSDANRGPPPPHPLHAKQSSPPFSTHPHKHERSQPHQASPYEYLPWQPPDVLRSWTRSWHVIVVAKFEFKPGHVIDDAKS